MNNPYMNNYPSLYRGIIESNEDPENLGRCKVRVPSVHGELTYPVDVLPWARPLVLSPVRSSKGTVNIPDVGDIVWVLFEGSMKDFPVYFGGTYAKGELDINSDVVDFYVEGSDKLSYHRNDRTYTIIVGDNKLKISPTSIDIIGNLKVSGSLNIAGNLTVSGKTTVNDLIINGICNKECEQ